MESKKWTAKWIWTSGLPREQKTHELVYFRRKFNAAEGKNSLKVKVTADSRYRLYINGISVSVGPCKGDLHTQYYESVDLSAYVKPGVNVIAAKVLHFAPGSPYVQGISGIASVWRSNAGAFLLQGSLINENGAAESLDTDEKWLCKEETAVEFQKEKFTAFVGGKEKVDGSRLLHGWRETDFDDGGWQNAVPFYNVLDPLFGELTPWSLKERTIPRLYENPKHFVLVTRSDNAPDNLLSFITDEKQDKITVRPHTKLFVEADAGYLTTGYINMILSGGKDSEIKILTSECYEKDTVGKRVKEIRVDLNGTCLKGESDIYKSGGNKKEEYETFWFRTFRYIRLEIETFDESLEIDAFYYKETGYPLNVSASFNCSDESMNKMWDISINTLKRCMHETYEDCPFYEQLQYEMDTRLQILFTYNISADDALARKAIYDFHSSLLPSGIIQSRYPCVKNQVIPGFAIFWIYMVHDHYMNFGDLDLVKRYRPTIDSILDWFDRHIGDQGQVDDIPEGYWPFVDWVKEWSATAGVPTAMKKGPMTVYSMMYSGALNIASELLDATGRSDTACEYRSRAERVNESVMKHCYSIKRGLFQDGAGVDEYSQHAQIWAVLSGIAKGPFAVDLMEKTISDHSLYQVSYAMTYFLFRALSSAGLYEKSFYLWDTWRHMIDMHLTTWTEDPVGQRSDCHAWGAVPLAEFPNEILGVKPLEAGYKKITIEPHIGHLTWAKGAVATKYGLVHVEWKAENGQFIIDAKMPEKSDIRVVMPDNSTKEYKASCIHEECPIK